ncbi:AraC family transcriptional regulator [Pseudoxanthomonas sp. Soil82]|uniref:AraC family transcriptional regulator n=1 Tax=Pseudoxanthomonas sp. Soil82 TaxID=3157341 RepID=UPI00338E8DE9
MAPPRKDLRRRDVKPALPTVDAAEVEALFDSIPDVLFFIKDREGRYTHVNATMLRRLGLRSRRDIIGRRASEVYPSGLGATYGLQDQQVLEGAVIDNLLELQLFPDQEPGWCLTCKRPLLRDGEVIGLIGISRDLASREGLEADYRSLREALVHMNRHYAENVRVQDLLAITGFSESKLERTFQKVFQLAPLQLLTRIRIQAAMHRLHGPGSIASIAQACGFGDQSAFTRRFVALVGMTPSEYRALRRD